jgi:hypothetical protein
MQNTRFKAAGDLDERCRTLNSTKKSRTGDCTQLDGDWQRGSTHAIAKAVGCDYSIMGKPEIIGIQESEKERGGKTCSQEPVIS